MSNDNPHSKMDSSPDTANGYVSENDAFSFCLASILLRKMVQCCLEYLCVRAIEQQTAVNFPPERFQTNHEKLYELEKRTELIQTTVFHTVDVILKAGRLTISPPEEI